MSVEREEERYEEVVSVPEGLIGLLPDTDVGGGEHHEHAKEHDVACYSACLGIMYLHGTLRAKLIPFNIVETAWISANQQSEPAGPLT